MVFATVRNVFWPYFRHYLATHLIKVSLARMLQQRTAPG
jgi:hypothetical protein